MRLVFAITSVFGATRAFETHGDDATLAVVLKHHDQIAAAARKAGARVVKFLGEGALLSFAASNAKEAISAMRALQAEGTRLWSAFDAGCSVRVKIGAGNVVAGMFGKGETARFDAFGLALNKLFKAAWEPEVNILPEAMQP